MSLAVRHTGTGPRMFLVMLTVGLAIVSGCLRPREDKPLTTEHLSLIARGGIEDGDASIEGGRPRKFYSLNAETAQSILKTLIPIKTSRTGSFDRASTEYFFGYQSGRDPFEFRIRVCGEKLCFAEHGFVYEGGNAAEFLEIVQQMFEQGGGGKAGE